MSDRNDGLLAGPGVMLLSAAIFGYFGFAFAYPEELGETGELIPMVVLLKWTVRGTAVAFLAAALIAMARPIAGDALFCVAGLISAIVFAIVDIWDMATPSLVSGIPWFLLFVFAAWNGWGSYAGLKAIRRAAGAGAAG